MSFYPLRPTLSRPIQVRSPAPLVHQDDIQQPYASTLKRPIRGRLLAPNTRHMILKESHWRGETPHIGLLLPHVPEALGCSHHGVSPCNYGIRLCLSPGNDIHSASYTFTTLTARLFPLQLRCTWIYNHCLPPSISFVCWRVTNFTFRSDFSLALPTTQFTCWLRCTAPRSIHSFTTSCSLYPGTSNQRIAVSKPPQT